MHEEAPSPESSHGRSPAPLAHVADPRVLAAVFAALIVLTVVTVAVSYFNFGSLNLFVAMGVATVKAALVAMYFMHLRYDNPLYAVFFLIGVAFLGLFLSITLLDSVEYQPEIQTWQQQNVR